MNRKSVLIIVLIIVLVGAAGYFAFIQYHRAELASEQTLATYNGELAACGAYPNNSTQSFIETDRETIKLPKDIYSPPDNKLTFTTASGTATAGWISNAGLAGESYGATATCWSYYYEFDGVGTVDLTATSTVKGMPDYLVHFVVAPAPVYSGAPTSFGVNMSGVTLPSNLDDQITLSFALTKDGSPVNGQTFALTSAGNYPLSSYGLSEATDLNGVISIKGSLNELASDFGGLVSAQDLYNAIQGGGSGTVSTTFASAGTYTLSIVASDTNGTIASRQFVFDIRTAKRKINE